MFDVLLITPDTSPREIERNVSAAFEAVGRERVALQLRSKQLPSAHRAELARRLRRISAAARVALLINDDVELARVLGAEGVQLSERGPDIARARTALGPEAWIGASRHDLAGIEQATRAGASFATISPIFEVPGKGIPLGLDGLREIAAATTLPLVALGGIDDARAAAVIESGVQAVAVMRHVLGQARPARALHSLLAAIDAGRQRARARGQCTR